MDNLWYLEYSYTSLNQLLALCTKNSAVIVALILFFAGSINAQNDASFYHLDVRDGLSQNSVYDITQDRQGFIWVATEFGLNRWDGKTFMHYLHKDGDSNSMSNNFLNCIYEDSKGTLWLGTNGSGISKFNKKKGTFENYAFASHKDSLFQNNSVWSITEDENSNLWIGTFGGGLKYFDTKTGTITSYQGIFSRQLGRNCKDIRKISVNNDGTLWLGAFDGGLYHFDPITKNIKSIKLIDGLDSYRAMSLLNQDSVLWIGSYANGAFRLNTLTQTVERYLYQDQEFITGAFIRDMVVDPRYPNSIWFTVWNKGVYKLDARNGTSNKYKQEKDNKLSLASNAVLPLFADRSGLIWVGSYKSGLSRFKPNSEKMEHIQIIDSVNRAASMGSINGISEFGSKVYLVSGSRGLLTWDKKLKSITQVQTAFTLGGYCLLRENDSIIWLGGTIDGLLRYNENTKKSEVFASDASKKGSISERGIRCALKDKKGRLWFGTYGKGLNLYQPETKTFTVFQNDPKDSNSLSDNTIMVLYEDKFANIWVGTGTGGLNRIDEKTEKFYRSKGQFAPDNGTSITGIQEDAENKLWVTTTTGLIRVERDNGTFLYTKYSSQDGLPNDRLSGLLIDNSGKLWISTVNGICSFQIIGETALIPQIKTYDQYDGIQQSEFSLCSAHKGASGYFYFGGFNAVTRFHPDSMTAKSMPPKLAFTSLKVMNELVSVKSDLPSTSNKVTRIEQSYFLPNDISCLGELELSYEEQVFSIAYASLDFNQPEKNEYAHKLEGFDKDWVFDGSKNSVTYTSLPSGNYKLLVKGSNRDAVWSEVHSINITITPPFWQTWWFILSLAVSVILIITFYVLSRIKRFENEKIILEKKVRERTAEIDQQRDEIEKKALELFSANEKLIAMGVFKDKLTSMLVHDLKNPLGSIVNSARQSNQNEHSKAIEYSAKLMLNLVMNILDVQQLQDNKIAVSKQAISLNELVDRALAFIELSIKHKNLKIKKNLGFDTVVLCDVSLIERVLINLLSNSVQYSALNSDISISATAIDDQFLELVIEDSGAGISYEILQKLQNSEQVLVEKGSDKYSTGIGLQYCQLALDAHDTRLLIDSKAGEGSRISFALKINQQKPLSSSSFEGRNIPLVTFNSVTRDSLKPIAEELKTYKFYEGGNIVQCLNSYPQKDQAALDWITEIKNAVYVSNEQKYEQLINLVLINER
ncbi:MAG: triple tyrosine motif-containing protein [Salibacteraceae bacterium]|nr:triple tyrosine motif-containing protein [Salibacteraceae bacterium]